MSKALRVKIIDYLRANNAVAKYVDICEHVLASGDSVEQRNELKATLDYLSNKRLIGVNGSYEFLHWTVSYGLYNIKNKVIAAKLTKLGLDYHPENGNDELEAAAHPVLAVIKKGAKADAAPTEYGDVLVATPFTEPAPLPWYNAPVQPEAETPITPTPLPWYTEPVAQEAKPVEPEPTPLPWYTEPKAEEVKPATPEPTLPWYTEPASEVKPAAPEPTVSPDTPTPEATLPWYTEPTSSEPVKLSGKFDDADDLKYDELPETTNVCDKQPKETYVAPFEPLAEAPAPELPWYTAPVAETPNVAEHIPTPVEPEQSLPWYTEPVAETPKVAEHIPTPVEPEQSLPWYTEPVAETPKVAEHIPAPVEPEQSLPWYTEPVADTPKVAEHIPAPVEPEQSLPWYTEPIAEAVKPVEPVAHVLPTPIEPKAEAVKPAEAAAPDAEPKKKLSGIEMVRAAISEHKPLVPWYEVPKEEPFNPQAPEPKAAEIKPVVAPEPVLPQHIEPKAEEVKPTEPVLPWYTEPKAEEVKPAEPVLPWYTEPKAEEVKPAEPVLPWYTEPKAEEPAPVAAQQPAPVEDKTEPVIYRFPPLVELKPEIKIKAPAPMAIERLNDNLSNSIDAISNIRLKKPAMLTGDFEKDSNVIMKFVLVVVLFLLFGCIVWLYYGSA